jgi:hypothetical protein
MRGDLSNTVIHPFFIYFSQLFGCNIFQEHKGEYSYLYTMCLYLRLTKEAIASMREDDDPLSFAEACQFMSLWCTYNHNTILGNQYFVKAMRIVTKYNIRFVSRYPGTPSQPHTPSWPLFSDEIAERVVFLSQLIYLQLHLRLITGDSDDLCYDLRHQFLNELPVCSLLFLPITFV